MNLFSHKLRIILISGKRISITICCGITQFTENDTAVSAYIRADNALYNTKRNGCKQCIIS
jgi:diguanylate cyclase